MRRIYISISIVILSFLNSCSKKIDAPMNNNDVSLLEFKLKGQMGPAIINRDYDEASAVVYIMETSDFDYSEVQVEGIVVSTGATANVSGGQSLNFSNPERRAKVRVTSESGNRMDWWIYLKPYDAFYVGTWRILDIKLCCNQKLANCGDGQWETQISGSEFGSFGKSEYDNRITITLNENSIGNNSLSGKIINDAGADGQYGHFWGVFSPYSVEAPLDMDSRLRHLLPPGEAEWELDLTTNIMTITRDNISSRMFFSGNGENCRFRFNLPSAASEPSRDGFYDNMWRSSYELFYDVYKMHN